MGKDKMAMLVGTFVLLLAIFPYLTILQTRFDTQPWALVTAVALAPAMVLRPGRPLALPGPLWLLLAIVIYAGSIYLINSDPYYGLRSLAGYASVFFLALAAYKTYRYVSAKPYIMAVILWLMVGLVQLTYDARFASWVVPRVSTGGIRGVTSLAVEPSYYATVVLFLLLLNEMFFAERKYSLRVYLGIVLASVVQIVISASALGLLFLAIFGAGKLAQMVLQRHSSTQLWSARLVALAIGITIIGFLQVDALSRTRAGDLFGKAVTSPTQLVYRDVSLADRAAHAILPAYSLYRSYGFGMGLGTWNEHGYDLAGIAGGWIMNLAEAEELSASGRVMSGWGSAVYELGMVGLLFAGITFKILVSSVRRNWRMKSACTVSLVVILPLMSMAVPLAFPLFGYLLGIHLYYAYADPLRSQGPYSVATSNPYPALPTMPPQHLGSSN